LSEVILNEIIRREQAMSNIRKQVSYKILVTIVWGLFGPLGIFNSSAAAQSYMFGRADFATGNGEPSSVATGDFNRDGMLDVAIGGVSSGNPVGTAITVSILLANADDTFQPPIQYTTRAVDSVVATWLAVGDFNRDGKLDLAVTGLGPVLILLGNGDGTFRAPVGYEAGSGPVVVGDLNGDGKLDLAVVKYKCLQTPCGPGSVSILLGNGDGTFQTHVDYATGTQPKSVRVADFNGDRKLDLAVVNFGDNTVSILLGRGDGTFEPHVDYAAGSYPSAVATGDLNGDGKVDLAAVNSADNTVSILLGNGDGTFKAHVDYPAGATFGRRGWGVTPGDFNGDGKLDLAVGSYCSNCNTSASVSILLGKGDGTFPTHVEHSSGGPYGAGAVTTGDFNRDGKLDLVFPNTFEGTFSILLGRGDGTFQHRASYAAGLYPKSVATADFNGDGKLDLAVTNDGSHTVSILLGNGNGTFQTHIDYATGSGPHQVAIGDFNGDGNLDLAVANLDASTVSILLGNGDGTFKAHEDYATDSDPISVATGDFNGDGKLDLAVASLAKNAVSILLGNGDGTFLSRVDYATVSGSRSVVVGDFNRDGKPDLAVANTSGQRVSILLGKGRWYISACRQLRRHRTSVRHHCRFQWGWEAGSGRRSWCQPCWWGGFRSAG
jgi:hypothetical protein